VRLYIVVERNPAWTDKGPYPETRNLIAIRARHEDAERIVKVLTETGDGTEVYEILEKIC